METRVWKSCILYEPRLWLHCTIDLTLNMPISCCSQQTHWIAGTLVFLSLFCGTGDWANIPTCAIPAFPAEPYPQPVMLLKHVTSCSGSGAELKKSVLPSWNPPWPSLLPTSLGTKGSPLPFLFPWKAHHSAPAVFGWSAHRPRHVHVGMVKWGSGRNSPNEEYRGGDGWMMPTHCWSPLCGDTLVAAGVISQNEDAIKVMVKRSELPTILLYQITPVEAAEEQIPVLRLGELGQATRRGVSIREEKAWVHPLWPEKPTDSSDVVASHPTSQTCGALLQSPAVTSALRRLCWPLFL